MNHLTLKIAGPDERIVPLVKQDHGYRQAVVEGVAPGTEYLYAIGEGIERPDPASHLHEDEALVAAVREGRKAEFAAFNWTREPPDPQSAATFERSKLQWEKREEGMHKALLAFYARLIRLRREIPALASLDREKLEVRRLKDRLLLLHRWQGDSHVVCMMNLGGEPVKAAADCPAGEWRKRLDSAQTEWGGPGSAVVEAIYPGDGDEVALQPYQCVLFEEGDVAAGNLDPIFGTGEADEQPRRHG